MKNGHEEILSGELFVTGKDQIEIEIVRGRPDTVLVEFKDHRRHHTPCDPHHDKLDWEVHHRHGKFVLVINWNVSGTREIIWAISF